MDSIRIKIKNYKTQDKFYFRGSFSNTEDSVDGFDYPKKRVRTNNKYYNDKIKAGLYIPKYWIEQCNFGLPTDYLVLEFSAPKLLYGTNLIEVKENELHNLVDKLFSFLQEIKVEVLQKDIVSGIVTLVAYGKNINVDKCYSPKQVIGVLSNFNYLPRSECELKNLAITKGTSLKYYNNHASLVVYDKMAEIQQGNRTLGEKKIIEGYKNQGGVISKCYGETIRFEYTLQCKRAVQQAMKLYYGVKRDYTLEDIFKDKINKEILNKKIDQVFNHPLNSIVVLSSFDVPVIEEAINKHYKYLGSRNNLKSAIDCLRSGGLKKLRQNTIQDYSKRTWYRYSNLLKKITKEIDLPNTENNTNLDALLFIIKAFGIVPSFNIDSKKGQGKLDF